MVELDELDDVSSDLLAGLVCQTAIIAIELLHRREISVTHTDNDDRAWQLSKLVDQVLGSRHVMDSAVSEEEQDLI